MSLSCGGAEALRARWSRKSIVPPQSGHRMECSLRCICRGEMALTPTSANPHRCCRKKERGHRPLSLVHSCWEGQTAEPSLFSSPPFVILPAPPIQPSLKETGSPRTFGTLVQRWLEFGAKPAPLRGLLAGAKRRYLFLAEPAPLHKVAKQSDPPRSTSLRLDKLSVYREASHEQSCGQFC
jgi:hypothetical protein